MKRRRLMRGVLGSAAVVLSLSACAILEALPEPTSIATLTPTLAPTFTPDPCTGWWCTVTGIVVAETTQSGHEPEGVTVTLRQTSYCSPTSGQQQAAIGPDGGFDFGDVFFHDTDRIRIEVESEGYEPVQWDSTDFYCLY
ncbi:MAG: hypothetical protein MUQ10_18460, partial [Anaerolineae bacterium]|nr:hypothetical protein [Anaerolineae bacterium]